MRISAVLLATVLPALAHAGEFDGIYRPADYQNWDCKTVGMDGGALAIKDGKFYGVESVCDLTQPTGVRGMDGVLFDMVCSAEGEEYSERMLIVHTQTGVLTVSRGYASELTRCPL